jgi:hypothetical protein
VASVLRDGKHQTQAATSPTTSPFIYRYTSVMHHLCIDHAPALLLIATAPLVAATGCGVSTTVAALLCIFMLRTLLKYRSLHGPEKLVLNTLAMSHYNEYVRWSMDRLGEPYEIRDNIGIIGVLFNGRFLPTLTIPMYKTSISNSRDILRFLYARFINEPRAVFLTPASGADADFEHLAVNDFAVHVRRVFYYWLFCERCPVLSRREIVNKLWGMYQPGVPKWQKLCMQLSQPLCIAALSKILKVDRRGYELSIAKVESTLDLIDKRLSDGRKYLVAGADHISYLDIAFASLGAPLILPPLYGGDTAVAKDTRIQMKDMPVVAQREAKRWLNRPSGRFIARIYEEERLTTSPT